MYKTGISDFSCQVGVSNSQTSIFFHNPTTKDLTWEVVSPRPTIRELTIGINDLPKDLVSKYPSLNVSQIVFKNGTAIQYIDDFTYQDYLSYLANKAQATRVNSNEYYAYEWK